MFHNAQRHIQFWYVLGAAFAVLALSRIIVLRGPLGSVVGEVGMVFLCGAQVASIERQQRGFPPADIRRLPVLGTYLAWRYIVLMSAAIVGVIGGGILFVLEVSHIISG